MNVNKLIIALVLAVVMAGCTKQAVGTSSTNNYRIHVELLFTDEDGCKVHRFGDYRTHYYVTCPGKVAGTTMTTDTCGKNCTYDSGVAGSDF